MDQQYLDIVKYFGGAIIAQFFTLIASNVKAKRNIKEMRALIRQQRETIEHLRDENTYLKGELNASHPSQDSVGSSREYADKSSGI